MKRAFLIAALAAQAGATPYDGLYRPGFGGWTCERDQLGMIGGSLGILDEAIHGLENTCRLSNPTPVRDMDATLYDESCEGEGMTSGGRVMVMRSEDGVIIVRDGSVTEWLRC